MIETAHLSKRFGATTALEDVGFTVEPGQIVGFLGQDVARAADLEHSRGALADLLQRNRAQHKENAA